MKKFRWYRDGVYSEGRGFTGGLRLFGWQLKIVLWCLLLMLMYACPSTVSTSEQTGDIDEGTNEVPVDSCGLPVPVPLNTIKQDTFIK